MSEIGGDSPETAPEGSRDTGTQLAGIQVVDPAVSRDKFAAEIAAYRLIEKEQQKRGWWMLEASFPIVFVVFATPQLKPAAVICGVLLDFTNYDLEPPSVRLVNPFTRAPYAMKDLPTALFRRQVVAMPALAASLPPGMPSVPMQFAQRVPLMQAHDPNEIPFLCVPGVREYHAHPAHSGDSWLVHRGSGVGTLYNILQTIYQYGVQPITSYGVALSVVGFEQGEAPA